LIVNEGGGFELRDLPEPRAPEGGLLLRVRLCGLCGSDVEKLTPGTTAAGRVLGHELACEVIAGELPAGTRVTVGNHVGCGLCERCRGGLEPLCSSYAASSLDPGGFCERTAASAAHVRGRSVLQLPAAVSDLAGTFVEPLACVLRGIEALPPGDPALVVGAGSIGLLAAQALRARGETVRVLDTDPQRRARAAELGFGEPLPGERFAAVLSTVAAALPDALRLVADAGTLVVFAGGGPVPLDVDAVYRRELRLVGVRSCTARHLHEALAALEAGSVVVEPLVDDVLALSEFDEGLRRYRSREALKVVFAP
jgi:L-iditol 2-dehydrogenase